MYILNVKHCAVLAACAGILYLYKIETDVKSISAISYEFRNIDHCNLFKLLTHPDTVSTWFKWIRHVRSADHKPLGVGKFYQVYYGRQPVLFQVKMYVPCEVIVLESESDLKPRFELRTTFVAKKRSRVMISIKFKESSALFQYSLGIVLQHLSKKKLTQSIKLIKLMLKRNSKLLTTIDIPEGKNILFTCVTSLKMVLFPTGEMQIKITVSTYLSTRDGTKQRS